MPVPRRSWRTTLEVSPQSITVVVLAPDRAEVLTAVFTSAPHHPRALLTLLEGVALWSGPPLCAAISVVQSVCPSLSWGGVDDLAQWPTESALVSGAVVDPPRPRRRLGRSSVLARRRRAEEAG
jgi:hypothetical protein